MRIRLVLMILAGTAAANSPTSAADRTVFLYDNGSQQAALIHDYANCWAEYVDGVDGYRFVETNRSEGVVELIDPGRDVGLRLHDRRVEIRLQGAKTWQPWGEGRWIEKGALPRSIRFQPTDWKIRLAYFLPTDRQPLDDYERRVRVVMELVNDIYTADFQAKGLRSEGLPFEVDGRGRPVVHLVRGSKPASYYNFAPEFDTTFRHFDRVAEEMPARIGSPRRHMIVVFPETYDAGPAPVEWRGSVGVGTHYSADGGLAVMSAWILRDEFCARDLEGQKRYLRDATPIPGRTAFGTGRANSPRFEFIEDGYGATAHELGHALGLPHDNRSPDFLMGQGFRHLGENYRTPEGRKRPVAFSPENTRLLAASRYLVPGVDRTDNIPPEARVRVEWRRGRAPSALVAIRASDDRALRAVVLVDTDRDTVVGGADLKGRSQLLTHRISRRLIVDRNQPRRNLFRLLVMVIDGGGNIARIESTTPW